MKKKELTIYVKVSILFFNLTLFYQNKEQWLLEIDMRIISGAATVVMCTAIINFKGNEVHASIGSRTGTSLLRIK